MLLNQEHQTICNSIEKILWEDWDPICVNDTEEARDEYKSYVPIIFNLVINDASKELITNSLYNISTITMGLYGNIEHCSKIADKIISLNANKRNDTTA